MGLEGEGGMDEQTDRRTDSQQPVKPEEANGGGGREGREFKKEDEHF